MNLGDFFSIIGLKREKVQVSKLQPEHLLDYKKRRQERNRKLDELKVLLAKSQALNAQLEADNAELWSWIYREYGLPSDRNYTIDEAGVIYKFVDPKEPRP